MKKALKIHLLPVVTVLLALGLAGSGLAWADNDHKFVPGELLIQVRAGIAKGNVDNLIRSHGAATAGEIKALRIRKIKVPEHARENVKRALAKNPNISFVENNHLAEAGLLPNDNQYTSQWHLPNISAPDGWDLTTGAQTVPIAIIDSGVDPDHPDLQDKLIAGHNFTDTDYAHGTAVAGAAAAMTDNVKGVAGVAWDNPIMPLVVLDATNYASYYDIAQAIRYAADNDVRIINISIGGSSASSTLQSAADYAWNLGAIIFACAQNYSTDTPYYPAACDNVMAVSATTSSDTLWGSSNYGNWIDISAPGASILTTNNGGDYGSWSGTSMASPIAAGVAALILSADPSLTNAQVVDILTQSADDLGTPGFDEFFGHGRVNAHQALLDTLCSTGSDTSDPTAVITSPQGGETVKSSITVAVSAEDSCGVDIVELYVDGELLSTDTTEPYTILWDTTGYADGVYDLYAIAYDTAGNPGESDVITVNVMNTPVRHPIPGVLFLLLE